MSEHSYFIFDPDLPEDAFEQGSVAYIPEWKSGEGSDCFKTLTHWSMHNFINNEEYLDPPDGSVIAYPKSHIASMVLRLASLGIYSSQEQFEGRVFKEEVVGYYIELPEKLSSRQKAWINLIEPPVINTEILLTISEYKILKHLKVVSGVHKKRPATLYKIDYNPLADKVTSSQKEVYIYLATIRPSSAKVLGLDYSWWLSSLLQGQFGSGNSYETHASAHKNLLVREERANQLKALIYTHYYTDQSDFMGEVYNISPYWISKQPTYDEDSLFYKFCGTDGWYSATYQANKLTVALVSLATTGYWSVECDGDDPTELITTAIESFVLAHKIDSSMANELYRIIYQPQNPFDMRESLLEYNALMPVLASICRHDINSAIKLADYFDNEKAENIVSQLMNDESDKTLPLNSLLHTLLKTQ